MSLFYPLPFITSILLLSSLSFVQALNHRGRHHRGRHHRGHHHHRHHHRRHPHRRHHHRRPFPIPTPTPTPTPTLAIPTPTLAIPITTPTIPTSTPTIPTPTPTISTPTLAIPTPTQVPAPATLAPTPNPTPTSIQHYVNIMVAQLFPETTGMAMCEGPMQVRFCVDETFQLCDRAKGQCPPCLGGDSIKGYRCFAKTESDECPVPFTVFDCLPNGPASTLAKSSTPPSPTDPIANGPEDGTAEKLRTAQIDKSNPFSTLLIILIILAVCVVLIIGLRSYRKHRRNDLTPKTVLYERQHLSCVTAADEEGRATSRVLMAQASTPIGISHFNDYAPEFRFCSSFVSLSSSIYDHETGSDYDDSNTIVSNPYNASVIRTPTNGGSIYGDLISNSLIGSDQGSVLLFRNENDSLFDIDSSSSEISASTDSESRFSDSDTAGTEYMDLEYSNSDHSRGTDHSSLDFEDYISDISEDQSDLDGSDYSLRSSLTYEKVPL